MPGRRSQSTFPRHNARAEKQCIFITHSRNRRDRGRGLAKLTLASLDHVPTPETWQLPGLSPQPWDASTRLRRHFSPRRCPDTATVVRKTTGPCMFSVHARHDDVSRTPVRRRSRHVPSPIEIINAAIAARE